MPVQSHPQQQAHASKIPPLINGISLLPDDYYYDNDDDDDDS